jgi:hypothetical protein
MPVWDCPKCGLVNPPESQFCDCGYDKVARKMDRERAPKGSTSGRGFFATYRFLYLTLAGLACGALGIILLLWEISERQPDSLGIIRSLLLAVFGFLLVGVAVWFRMKSG